MADLVLKHIYKIYSDGTKAVSDFNLEIKDNEFIILVGPSGCGKSTTLRMIAGLEDITAGDFYIDDVLANNLEPKDRDMAMVFQNYALYPHMTVFDNMAFGLKIKHINKEEISSRVHEAAKILDIEDQLDKKPKDMSGGQKQRVALGRAIVRHPKVFLLDEPLSNLDAKLRSSMRSEITRLHDKLKITFIYVTHDQVEAMTMGTRIVVMNKGVMQQVDTPMNLYDHPINKFVAGFIGTPQMNFIKAKLNCDENFILIKIDDDNTLKISRNIINKFDLFSAITNKEVSLGLRPEYIEILKENDLNKHTIIKAKIMMIETLGNEMIVEAKFNDNRLNIKVSRDDSLKVNQEVYLNVLEDKIYLFNNENEMTLFPVLPEFSLLKGVCDGEELKLLGTTFKIPLLLKEKLKNYNKETLFLNIPTKSITLGSTYQINIIKKEKINKKWLFIGKYNNEFIYFVNDNYIDGDKIEVDINLNDVDIYHNKEIIVNHINKINKIESKLHPVTKKMPFKTKKGNIKYKNKKVFDYSLEDIVIPLNDELIDKIYSLLGKRFMEHDLIYVVNADDFIFDNNNFNITGFISNVHNYDNEVYYDVKVNNLSLIVKGNLDNILKEGEAVKLFIDPNKIGLIDKTFDVTLL